MDGYGSPSSKKGRVPYHMVMITFIQKVVLLWYLIKMVLESNETSSKKQGILIEFSWQYKTERERERERLTFLNSKEKRAERAQREIDGVGVVLGVKNNEEKGRLYSFSSVHLTHRNLWNQRQHLTVYTSQRFQSHSFALLSQHNLHHFPEQVPRYFSVHSRLLKNLGAFIYITF